MAIFFVIFKGIRQRPLYIKTTHQQDLYLFSLQISPDINAPEIHIAKSGDNNKIAGIGS